MIGLFGFSGRGQLLPWVRRFDEQIMLTGNRPGRYSKRWFETATPTPTSLTRQKMKPDRCGCQTKRLGARPS